MSTSWRTRTAPAAAIVQRAVDRRFDRKRYDAEAVVVAFTARLRRTVDLDAIRGDLVGVVQEAFQPAHVSVWLPGPELSSRSTTKEIGHDE